MRARTKPWTHNEIATNPLILENPEANKGGWRTALGAPAQAPLHVELGCGKGRFITQMALRNPDVYYIAVEREPHVIVSGARFARENNLPITFVLGDVSNLSDLFAPGEIDRLYINFCDPWPNKKKWAKRRLTHSRFLAQYQTLLAEKGSIHFKTDNRQLFEFSLNEFAANDWKMSNISLDLHNSDYTDNIMTEYEEKFSSRGFSIFRLEAEKPKF